MAAMDVHSAPVKDRVADRETGVRHALDDAQWTEVRVNT
jgi:hypothetical protein